MSPVAGAWVPSLDILITTPRITMSTATFYNRTFKNILNLVGTRSISRGNKKANVTRLQFRNFPNMETDTVIVTITAYVWIPSILLYISTTQSGALLDHKVAMSRRCSGALPNYTRPAARCMRYFSTEPHRGLHFKHDIFSCKSLFYLSVSYSKQFARAEQWSAGSPPNCTQGNHLSWALKVFSSDAHCCIPP